MRTFRHYLRFWKVSFIDWMWFVFYLKCNELSPKLNTAYQVTIKKKKLHDAVKYVTHARERAHRVEMELTSQE